MIYCLEMRNTADWQDCRYRQYTTSARKADAFKKVPRIQFTDSGHGVVPVVTESASRRRHGPCITTLADHVQSAMSRAAPVEKHATVAQRIAGAVAAEREACAALAREHSCQTWAECCPCGSEIALAIEARGQS